VVQVCQLTKEDLKLDTDEPEPSVVTLLPEIQQLLNSYADIFAAKVEFPTNRDCSHSIPLVPGARQINIRPYRYAPAR
jgi:hypothetical protein